MAVAAGCLRFPQVMDWCRAAAQWRQGEEIVILYMAKFLKDLKGDETSHHFY